MARIEASDIDSLVETVGFLKLLSKKESNSAISNKIENLASHVRKVYILLLHASGWSIEDLKQLTLENRYCDPELEKAINALCPHTGQNQPSPL
jgi:hypothetical protein